MPRWLMWCLNLVVIGILAALVAVFRETGTVFNLGFIAGFAVCYVLFRCWRQDYADEAKAHFTE